METPISSQQQDYHELMNEPYSGNTPAKKEVTQPKKKKSVAPKKEQAGNSNTPPSIDLNGDGKISFEEFCALKVRHGEARGKPFKDELVSNLFTRKDTDQDGFLSFRELATNPD